jgi:hypothetical protein
MSKLTLFVVSGKIDRVGRLHGRSKFSSELVWRSWSGWKGDETHFHRVQTFSKNRISRLSITNGYLYGLTDFQ